MAGLRCPMCGKDNPSDLEVCKYCQARLKPIWESSGSNPINQIGEPLQPTHASDMSSEMPDWLKVIREPNQNEGQQGDHEEEALPVWLSNLRDLTPTGDSFAEATDLDWLSELQEKSPEFPDAETPDWLEQDSEEQHFPKEVYQDETSEGKQEERKVDDGLPDWLSTASTPEETLPSWLTEEETAEQDITTPKWMDEEPPLPEWLARQAAGTESESFEDTKPGEFDWLDGLLAEDEIRSTQLPDHADSPDGLSVKVDQPVPSQQGREDLNWLKELEDAFPGMPQAPELFGEHLETTPPSSSSIGDKPIDLGLGDLPDWLTEASVGKTSDERSAEGSGEPHLFPSQLPSWLEAMRPIVTDDLVGLPPELDSPAESAGPLAGLRGVLSVEPGSYQVIKPTSYTNRLQVSELQQSQANLFRKMIDEASEAKPLPAQPILTRQQLIQSLLFLLMVVVMIVSMVLKLPAPSAPAFSGEIGAASQLINALAPGSPVLVAVDYQPGFSGEMDATAGVVMDHLMRRGVSIALVSTTPTGPIQAERLIALSNQLGQHQYQYSSQYVNLGFVPGGSSGLLSFARYPRRTTLTDVKGEGVWESGFLHDVEKLADFYLVIVITESSDIAQAWIEQVQPKLGRAQLIMVVSAQAGPLVRPYYEIRPSQVQGIVAGLAAGVSYEVMQGRILTANNYWTPFNAGVWLSILLVLVSSVYYLLKSFLATPREKQSTQRSL